MPSDQRECTDTLQQAAAILAAGLRDWIDLGVIIGLLMLNASVGFIQEYQAGSIVDELKKTLALKAVVIRGGKIVEVGASEVVPGDILQIEEVNYAISPVSKVQVLMLYRVRLSPPMAVLLPKTLTFKLINPQSLENPLRLTNTQETLSMLPRLSSVATASW